ncbi:hypothetical protein GcM1_159009 [Golovinomyces cichoracearum]|uniref:Uncharacterized protein n=1 Tax=Golovinomyces cichoracearum TaxID=62708 RepID=A0A420J9G9_9PEZI|nr:hypothetical protein GcM1_159009 [Golovinomyces cichoracearum]
MKPDEHNSIEGTGSRNGTCTHFHNNIEPRIGNLLASLDTPNGIAFAANKNDLIMNKDEEHARLCFEDAFFLSHDTGCSNALDPGSGFSATERNLFSPCGQLSSLPPITNQLYSELRSPLARISSPIWNKSVR